MTKRDTSPPSTEVAAGAASAASTDKPLLFTPLMLRDLKIRNRIVASPMCQYASENGAPGDWQLVNFGRFAIGGAGIVFGEETAIEPEGRKTHECAGLWCDEHIPAYRRITDFIRQQGAVAAVQLGHAGGKASCHGAQQDWKPLTPENSMPGHAPWIRRIPSQEYRPAGYPPGHELTIADIKDQLARWREATLRALDAGYQIIEIHGAHGYLIHQFLSPITNRRTDAYGKDRNGRMRFALEVAETVRENWPKEYPVFYRISAVDGKGGSWDLNDSVILAGELKQRGIDVIDCSSGGINGTGDMQIVPRVPGYQVDFSSTIKKQAQIATMAVGLITEPQQAEAILQQGQSDLVALARELMWKPNWPAYAADVLLGDNAGHDLLPQQERFRLKRRVEVSKMSINQPHRATGREQFLIEST